MNFNIKNLDFSKSADGLLPVIIQDAATRHVLMLGYMNAEALEKTMTKKIVTFFSRSKQRLWTKGETSGHTLLVRDVFLDCDADTLLVHVDPQGPSCHTGRPACFFRKINSASLHHEKTVGKKRLQTIFVKFSGVNNAFQSVHIVARRQRNAKPMNRRFQIACFEMPTLNIMS